LINFTKDKVKKKKKNIEYFNGKRKNSNIILKSTIRIIENIFENKIKKNLIIIIKCALKLKENK
jgi:hypothetical protein